MMKGLFYIIQLGSVCLPLAWAWSAPLTVPANLFSDLGKAKLTGDHLNFQENTEAKVAIKVPVSFPHHLIITARGDRALGESAIMRVAVDGVTVAELMTMSGPEWRTHMVNLDLTEGERVISVRFVNDGVDKDVGDDRNLYLHSITLIQSEDVPGLDVVSIESYQDVQEQRRLKVLDDAARIARQIRMGPVVVQVLDAEGAPIDQAHVVLETVDSRFKLGTALATAAFDPETPMDGHVAYKNLAAFLFNEVVPENAMKWAAMEPQDGDRSTSSLDAMLAWAVEKGMSVRGHCLFWSCEERIQDWVTALDDEHLVVRIEQRIKEVVDAYPQVLEFDVNNEMLHCEYFKDRLGPDIRTRMFKLSQQASESAILYVNDFDILNGLSNDQYMEQIQNLLASGAPIGGIGIQAHLGEDVDLATVRQILDQLALFNLPIKLTELDVNVADEDLQAQIFEDVMRVAYGHPAVEGVLLWGFWEDAHWRPDAALYRSDFTPKLSGQVLEDLVNEWRPSLAKDTGPEGLVDDYLTYGACKVVVTAKGYRKDTVKFEHVLGQDGEPTRINVVLKKRK